ncbi:hypothetical protein CAEBREN_10971 [Caenorhabditis brenneri]|uniref:Uncharacterized protein n=1 Tax=Caenorhabditis brenneri TaxID=135651 RepID=G0M777_CAEBE|nr:hypothetical protein CAEBREN_10971 [Caenorhabditis brenneri]
MNSLLLLFLCVAILAVKAVPIREQISGEDTGTPSVQGEFEFYNDHRVFDAESDQKDLLHFTDLQVLPMMKKSIAIGRAGFRPGKRAVIDISDF